MFKLLPQYQQFVVIICCNLLTLSFGLSTGWPTINFIDLQNVNSTFSTGPLTLDEASWVVSLVFAGAFLGTFAILLITQFVGVKRTIHLFALPMILSSVLVIWAQNVYYLYAARVLSGIVGGGLAVAIPSFVNDIANDNIRGALNTLYDPSFNCGIIMSYVLGNHLSCLDQAKVQLIMPIIFVIILFVFPESPEYWLKRNKNELAFKSQEFYKGKAGPIELQKEKIENGNTEKVHATDNTDSKLTIRDFVTPQARKAFFISFTSLLLCFTAGTMTMLSYVTDIFSKTGSSLSEKNSSLLISITQIIGNLVLLNIIERFNRRTLYICSSILTMVSYFLFATYCLLWINQPEYQWMPPFCFALIVFSSCLGLLPMPYIITVEIFPKKIRSACIALAVSFLWLILFVFGTIFPSFMQCFDLPICMLILGIVSSLNALFGYFFVPETRGKSYEEIMELLK